MILKILLINHHIENFDYGHILKLLVSNSFAKISYASAPGECGAYSEIGNPYEGASAKRIFLGIILLNTWLGKCLFTSRTTSDERLVRLSNIVRITPRTFNSGKSADRTRSIVWVSCPNPSSARYSHCTGTTTPSIAAINPFTVNKPSEGGQSIST